MAKAKPKNRPRKLTKPLSTDATIAASYGLVCDMESDVTAAGQFADAIAMLAEALTGPEEGLVVQRLAWTIKVRCAAIEVRRGNLFRLLHPNRAEGPWPVAPAKKLRLPAAGSLS
jgi:hypothetical protein